MHILPVYFLDEDVTGLQCDLEQLLSTRQTNTFPLLDDTYMIDNGNACAETSNIMC